MKILFAINEPYLPDVIGGGVLGIHHQALQLVARGCEVEVLAAEKQSSPEKQSSRWRSRAARLHTSRSLLSRQVDDRTGYTTRRVPSGVVRRALERYLDLTPPDIVMVQGAGREWLAQVALARKIPTIMGVVCAECSDAIQQSARESPAIAQMLSDPLLKIFCPSHFLSTRVRDQLGIDAVVMYSLMPLDECIATDRTPEFVTFVNPVQVKGLEVALGVAELLPQRRFLFVETWPLGPDGRSRLAASLEAHPNVVCMACTPRVSDIYRSTKVLLMPSQWEEGFGRVAVEACYNGIPVVASRIGGIPEALGDSGILLEPHDSPSVWAAEVERVLCDRAVYDWLSAKAVTSAGRPEFRTENITSHFLEVAAELASINLPNGEPLCDSSSTATRDSVTVSSRM